MAKKNKTFSLVESDPEDELTIKPKKKKKKEKKKERDKSESEDEFDKMERERWVKLYFKFRNYSTKPTDYAELLRKINMIFL